MNFENIHWDVLHGEDISRQSYDESIRIWWKKSIFSVGRRRPRWQLWLLGRRRRCSWRIPGCLRRRVPPLPRWVYVGGSMDDGKHIDLKDHFALLVDEDEVATVRCLEPDYGNMDKLFWLTRNLAIWGSASGESNRRFRTTSLGIMTPSLKEALLSIVSEPNHNPRTFHHPVRLNIPEVLDIPKHG